MTSEKAKMLDGKPYDAADPELAAERERARDLTSRYNDTTAGDDVERRELLDELFGSVGEGVAVEPPVRCDYGYNVHVGDDFYANFDCVLLDVRRIEIGRNCLIGPGTHVYTATHPVDAEERAEGLESGEPVTIGDDVWIGGRAVLNPGVSVGDGAVIAAGAVVVDDVPDGVVVGGNPATVVRELDGSDLDGAETAGG
ncbi:sugar O-acetyltransferase [Halorubrum halodurans]|uniref:Acetyltransferase n=1 Tax=Halorubrum halodurans TaxID=1383851 RepID=A0A256IR57_9EURY|nr:sugar O-acetyltransferase [Halorubrum halodurans]OYR59024.1 acetyltransferase [Halorubrum halodurans]